MESDGIMGIRTLQEWIPLYDYERFRELIVLYGGDLLEKIDIFMKQAASPQKSDLVDRRRK